MAKAAPRGATEPAMNLLEKSEHLASEASRWISGNIVDVIIAIAIGSVIALVLLGIRRFGRRLAERSEGISWRTIGGRVLAKTTFFFIVMCAAELVAEHAETPPSLLRAITILFVIAASLQGAIWGRELILGLVEHKVGNDTEASQSALGSAIGIIRLLVTVALFAIAVIFILDNLGINVTGLVAGLGIGGIAIGLAAQGIFKDLFSALAIILDRPFRRGDAITFEQTTGIVERIGLKSTRVRSLSGEEVVISNDKLLNTKIQNWAHLHRRRQVMVLSLIHQTPPELLARLPDQIRKIVEAEEHASFDRAHVAAFMPSSIDLELVFFVDSADYSLFMDIKQRIMLAILRRFAELGATFAYPTQTSFTAGPDGRYVLPYPPAHNLAAEVGEA
jgi:small-conductance mechanosensitive channel